MTMTLSVDNIGEGPTNSCHKMALSPSHAKKLESRARAAKWAAIQAERVANRIEARAGRIKLDIQAHAHYIKVQTEVIQDLCKMVANELEVRNQCLVAQTAVTVASQKVRVLERETKAKAEPFMRIVRAKNAEIKKINNALKTNKPSKAEVRKLKIDLKKAQAAINVAKAEVFAIEAPIRVAKAEVRKATLGVKKADLAVEEVERAKELIIKHRKALDEANDKIELKKIEQEGRKAEVEAKRAQAKAKKAEVEAIIAGDMKTAEILKLEARAHRAEAEIKDIEIKEMLQVKPRRKKAAQPAEAQVKQRQPRAVEKKYMSARGMLDIAYKDFQKIADPIKIRRKSQNGQNQITLTDCLMSGLALFSLKYPSLLQFDKDSREGGCIRHNLKTLYHVDHPPSDTYMRERLDEIDPAHLRLPFKDIFAAFQRSKELEKYEFLDGQFLLSCDGTGFFSSTEVMCKNCCQKSHQNGSVSYYHQMMCAVIAHPDYETIIPLCPEAIKKEDGSEKNDCERNASERLLRHIRREHPHLKLICTQDAIASNGPYIRLLGELDMRYIIVVKPDGNTSLFEELKGTSLEKHTYTDEYYSYEFKFTNKVPLNDTHANLEVNYFEVKICDKAGKMQYHNSWITDIPITKHNVHRLCQGGRAKWKIENETFNTLKNQGYNFEHNYGHGSTHLSTVLALLMMLAFLIDQVQQSSCGLFQGALKKMTSRARLWGRMRAYFTTLEISSWQELWQGITFGIQGGRLIPNLPPLDTS
jgi:hypothetical protein